MWTVALLQYRRDFAPRPRSTGVFVNRLGQQKIKLGDTSGIVCTEVDGDAVVYVEPLRMMVHGFGFGRHLRHESKRPDEVVELQIPVKFAVLETPGGQALQSLLDFIGLQLLPASRSLSFRIGADPSHVSAARDTDHGASRRETAG